MFYKLVIFFSFCTLNSIAQNNTDTLPVTISTLQYKLQRNNLPIAVGKINNATLKLINPQQWGDVLNRISGVQFINLGNEQHAFAIRQPISFKSFFSFTENGIAIRPTGIFNNNALLEIHNADVQSIDVIKGTASALYGNDAIGGVVNYVTQNATNTYLKLQATHHRNFRLDALKKISTNPNNKWVLSASVANRNNFPIAHYNYNKQSFAISNTKIFNAKLQLNTRAVYVNYKSDMIDSKDSTAYFNKDYSSKHSFTYRAVKAFRLTSILNYTTGQNSFAAYISLRNNNQTQNPSYLISEAVWFGGSPLKAHGEINTQKFTSYVAGLNAQRIIKNGYVLYGLSADVSPTNFNRNYIAINKNAQGNYINFLKTDSFIAKTKHLITNFGTYIQYHKNITPNFLIDAGLRFDAIAYKNKLATPATNNNFNFTTASPRLGIVYKLKNVTFYSNIGKGFTPPQITDLYGNATPLNLKAAYFINYETGAWYNNKTNNFFAEINIFNLRGYNEIVYSLRNNVLQTINAGQTSHTGIEYTLKYNKLKHIEFLFSGSVSKHTYIQYEDEGKFFNGYQMPWASKHNFLFSVAYKALIHKNILNTMLNVNRVGKYFLDDLNTLTYNGHTIYNLNLNYTIQKSLTSIFIQAYNIFNTHHAVLAYKGKYGYGYNLGEPVTINAGLQLNFK